MTRLQNTCRRLPHARACDVRLAYRELVVGILRQQHALKHNFLARLNL